MGFKPLKLPIICTLVVGRQALADGSQLKSTKMNTHVTLGAGTQLHHNPHQDIGI